MIKWVNIKTGKRGKSFENFDEILKEYPNNPGAYGTNVIYRFDINFGLIMEDYIESEDWIKNSQLEKIRRKCRDGLNKTDNPLEILGCGEVLFPEQSL